METEKPWKSDCWRRKQMFWQQSNKLEVSEMWHFRGNASTELGPFLYSVYCSWTSSQSYSTWRKAWDTIYNLHSTISCGSGLQLLWAYMLKGYFRNRIKRNACINFQNWHFLWIEFCLPSLQPERSCLVDKSEGNWCHSSLDRFSRILFSSLVTTFQFWLSVHPRISLFWISSVWQVLLNVHFQSFIIYTQPKMKIIS
jgi:hypothetical protein